MTETLHNIAAGLHDRFLDGELDESGRRWLAEHRAVCPACNVRFARVERILETLSTLERPAPSPGFADRVLAQVRPAPAPAWARWQISGLWRRAAATALLVAGGLVAIAALPLLGLLAGELGGPADPFNAPGVLADGLMMVLRVLAPLRSLAEVVAVLAHAVISAVATPQMLGAAAASVILSSAALLELLHILAPSQRRRLVHG
jgi:anti-sigma factor RsiW